MAKEEKAEAGNNELQKMLDQVVENAHARLDMAADILRAAVSSIPPEELAKLLLAAAPQKPEAPAAEARPAEPAAAAPAAEDKAPKEAKKAAS